MRTRLLRGLLSCLLLALVACGGQAASTDRSAPATSAPSSNAATADPATPTPVPAVDHELPVVTTTPDASGPALLREDLRIRKVAEVGGGFIRLAQDPLSGAVFVLNSQGTIRRLDVKPDAGSSTTQVYGSADIGGAPATTGMAFGPDGTLYVVGNEGQETTSRAIIRKGTPDGSGGRTWSSLASTEPYPKSNTQYDHQVNGIVVSPDGAHIYVNSGSRTEHGEVQTSQGAFPGTREVPLTSAIFRLPANGADLVLPNDEAQLKAQGYLFADGLRNSYDLAFNAEGDLFATENGPDADLPDELNWIREGHHYGFPWRFGDEANPQTLPDYDPAQDPRLDEQFLAVEQGLYRHDPEFPPPPMAFTDPVANLGPDADKFRDPEGTEQDASDSGRPIYTFTPHRAPLGLSFDTAGALATFKNDGFVLSWGWGIERPTLSDTGQDLLHLDLAKQDDRYEARVTQIARGFDHPIDSVLIGNALYVLEYGGKGAIWEITLP